MNVKQIICICFLAIFYSCQNSVQENTLFGNTLCVDHSPEKVPLSKLMTEHFRIIPLETVEASLIGRIDKIKKTNDNFYILSNDQWVFQFDKTGKYISSLKQRGNGPEEYTHISDFDVYNIKGKNEIWLADNTKIKIYDADDLSFLRTINFPFVVNKFRRIAENKILVMNGQSENSIFVLNEKGEKITEFLKKEIPFLLFRSIQFKPYNNNSFLFQLGVSNDYVIYNEKEEEFHEGSFFDRRNKLLTKQQLMDIFDKHGQDFISFFNQNNYIQSFSNMGDNTWFDIYNKKDRFISKVMPDKRVVSASLSPHCTIENDLFNVKDFSFLYTMGFGESPNSILMYINTSILEGIDTLYIQGGDSISIDSEGNPFLIEFYE